MNYEKKYKNALEQTESFIKRGGGYDRQVMESIFSELKKSGDERIKKELMAFFIEVRNREGNEGYWHDLKVTDILAYLEKQKEQKPVTKDGQQECPYKDLTLVKDFFGKYKRKCKLSNKACDSKECEQWNELQAEFKRINEAFENGKNEVINHPEVFGLQKPAEWSEEDERVRNAILEFINPDKGGTKYSSNAQLVEWSNWLKSLPLNLKKKNEDVTKLCSNEWSEEDKAIVGCIACYLDGQLIPEGARKQCQEWFNRHRRDFLNNSSWKPSEEQMMVLTDVAYGTYQSEYGPIFRELIEQLKRLL